MASINSINDNEPSTPLLSKRPQHKIDEEQGCKPRSSRTMAIAYDDKVAEDQSQWTDTLGVVSIALPALLFMQFGMVFSISPALAGTGLLWSTMNANIVMFVILAALYRQTVQDLQITYLVTRLLPDIICGTILGLVFCDQVVPALLLLLSSMLCMAVFVAVNSIYYLVVNYRKTSLEVEYDEESVHDEFGPGFEPLFDV
jgi:hypothetical protein